MKTWSTRTNLSLFVNGQLLAWTNQTSYTAKDGQAVLYLGYDATTNTRFKGIVDEFRLYKTALTPDGVKGLVWFLKGANNLLIPRGVFYESKMYRQLNDSATNFSSANSPLQGAVVNGNTNPLASNRNSRVIQMVITRT